MRRRLRAVECECPTITSGSLPYLELYLEPTAFLVALVVTARRFVEPEQPFVLLRPLLTHRAVHMIHQLWYLTTLHLIMAHLASPFAFMVPLASNHVYSLFAGAASLLSRSSRKCHDGSGESREH